MIGMRNAYSQGSPDQNPPSPDHGVFRVLTRRRLCNHRAPIFASQARSKMVPDFRDETIGFRCAVSSA